MKYNLINLKGNHPELSTYSGYLHMLCLLGKFSDIELLYEGYLVQCIEYKSREENFLTMAKESPNDK